MAEVMEADVPRDGASVESEPTPRAPGRFTRLLLLLEPAAMPPTPMLIGEHGASTAHGPAQDLVSGYVALVHRAIRPRVQEAAGTLGGSGKGSFQVRAQPARN
ncbi:MAG TPA: hypothetical protein VM683_04340, partial [Anaeromyxobacteraceae bacterium]|nr:hypothetical protein [Anaeromyxobacteraceae bacterium]